MIIYLIPALGILALLYGFTKISKLRHRETDISNKLSVNRIAGDVTALFRQRQLKIISGISISVAVVLFFFTHAEISSWSIPLAFILGTIVCWSASLLTFKIAHEISVFQTTSSSKSEPFAKRYSTAFIISTSITGLVLVGLGGVFAFLGTLFKLQDIGIATNVTIITSGFILGISITAFIIQLAINSMNGAMQWGEHFTTISESILPISQQYNPVSLAKNVSQTIKNITGNSIAFFESYLGTLFGAMVLGLSFMNNPEWIEKDFLNGLAAVLLPLVLAAAGIITSLISLQIIRQKGSTNLNRWIPIGDYIASGIAAITSWFIIDWMLPTNWTFGGIEYTPNGVFLALFGGLAARLFVRFFPKFYPSSQKEPSLQSTSKNSDNFSFYHYFQNEKKGLTATTSHLFVIAAVTIWGYEMSGLYGIAIAALGMMINMGLQIGLDAYSVAHENAGAPMSELPTSLTLQPGQAISTAALTALTLFVSYFSIYNITHETTLAGIDISQPPVIITLLLGTLLPFLIDTLSINSISEAASSLVKNIRDQFKNKPKLSHIKELLHSNKDLILEQWSDAHQETVKKALDGIDHNALINATSGSSHRQLILPTLLVILIPISVGFLGGAELLGGLLIGIIIATMSFTLYRSHRTFATETSTIPDGSALLNTTMKLVIIIALTIAPII